MWHDSASEDDLYIRVADDVKRGRGSPQFPLQDARLLKVEHHDAIEAFIAECHSVKGGRVTLQILQQHLAEKFKSPDDPQEPFTVSQDVLRYCLVNQLGYQYGKVRLLPNAGLQNASERTVDDMMKPHRVFPKPPPRSSRCSLPPIWSAAARPNLPETAGGRHLCPPSTPQQASAKLPSSSAFSHLATSSGRASRRRGRQFDR
eukprot:COSAG02_NODE_6274_length_3687_cov_1.680602_1_plen_203_part_00